jgi:uncharacterized membrane protein YedE/YeeE
MHDLSYALAGGLLIGAAAAVLLLVDGREAGISGICGGLLAGPRDEWRWRARFFVGLVAAGLAGAWLAPGRFAAPPRSTLALVAGGLLVGFGTRLGGGCTSGHGLCGMSAGSKRSIVGTVAFFSVGVATAIAVDRLFGGVL